MSIAQRPIGVSSRPIGRRLSGGYNQSTSAIGRRRSNSIGNCTIEKRRGFRPSDRFDPATKDFLVKLSRKFWCRVSNKIVYNTKLL